MLLGNVLCPAREPICAPYAYEVQNMKLYTQVPISFSRKNHVIYRQVFDGIMGYKIIYTYGVTLINGVFILSILVAFSNFATKDNQQR